MHPQRTPLGTPLGTPLALVTAFLPLAASAQAELPEVIVSASPLEEAGFVALPVCAQNPDPDSAIPAVLPDAPHTLMLPARKAGRSVVLSFCMMGGAGVVRTDEMDAMAKLAFVAATRADAVYALSEPKAGLYMTTSGEPDEKDRTIYQTNIKTGAETRSLLIGVATKAMPR